MSTGELIRQARYVVDVTGRKTAVQFDIDAWEQFLRTEPDAVINTGGGSYVEGLADNATSLDPAKNPLLDFIGAVSVGGLADNIDEELYGK